MTHQDIVAERLPRREQGARRKACANSSSCSRALLAQKRAGARPTHRVDRGEHRR